MAQSVARLTVETEVLAFGENDHVIHSGVIFPFPLIQKAVVSY